MTSMVLYKLYPNNGNLTVSFSCFFSQPDARRISQATFSINFAKTFNHKNIAFPVLEPCGIPKLFRKWRHKTEAAYHGRPVCRHMLTGGVISYMWSLLVEMTKEWHSPACPWRPAVTDYCPQHRPRGPGGTGQEIEQTVWRYSHHWQEWCYMKQWPYCYINCYHGI